MNLNLFLLDTDLGMKFLGYIVHDKKMSKSFPKWLCHLHSLHPCLRAPVPSNSDQNLILSIIFLMAILIVVQWYLLVTLICINQSFP